MVHQPPSFAHRQRGAATLVFAVTILFLVSLITVYVSQSVLFDQKIANNDVRHKHSFEAAETGMAAAKAYIRNDPDVDDDGVLDPVFDTNNDGLGDSATANVGNGNSVTVTVADLSGGLMNTLLITSQGFSDDQTANSTVQQTVTRVDPLPNAPGNPFTTRSSVVIQGSATIHNPQGHSTIWSGGDIDLGSNNSTGTEIADPTDVGYPACMEVAMSCNTIQSSNKVIVGLDVIENDATLGNMTADQMFANFFGLSPQQFRDAMATIDTTPGNAATDVQLATNEIIWVDGDTALSGSTVGCESAVTGGNICPLNDREPSILVIDGDLDLSGTPHFYGLVYVTGDLTGTGNSTFHGALVTAGIVNLASGSLDVWFNSDLIDTLRTIGPIGNPSGSWKDF